MAKFGYDVPYQRKPSDAAKRLEIFQIIKPSCFSQQDLHEIEAYPDNIRAMWLTTFTNSQNVMVRSKLLQQAKDYFRRYFPDKGASPKQTYGKRIGLAAGQSILDR